MKTKKNSLSSSVKDEGDKYVKFFRFYGVDLAKKTSTEAVGDCPFCNTEGKFSVNIERGLWRCFVCGEGGDKGGGNDLLFLRRIHIYSMKSTSKEDYKWLAKHRGLIYSSTLKMWGVCKLTTNDGWVVPAYSTDGRLRQLYRYIKNPEGKYILYSGPNMKQQLFGLDLFDSQKSSMLICEGPWDAMTLWETMSNAKKEDERYSLIGKQDKSILESTNIIAVPGCGVFDDSWCQLFEDKNISLLYDSDHPKKTTKGSRTVPAGYAGMERAASIIAAYDGKPQSLRYLHWGDKGYDEKKKSGYDIRDMLTSKETISDRIKLLSDIFIKLKIVPQTWLKDVVLAKDDKIKPILCEDWRTLIEAWKSALQWTDGLDKALCVMLASIISTKTLGDPLWVKIVGPPSTGKSTLSEAISTSKHVVPKSNMRGFISGFKTDSEGKEDNSLINKLRDKTLVIKDGDTLLQSPNLPQILAEARDIYDGDTRSSYRNAINREYNNIKMSFILCGTSSLRTLDTSELGERFLDCVIMDDIPLSLERQILLSVALKTDANTKAQSNGKAESNHDKDLVRARALTAGYINHLRQFISGENVERCSLLLRGIEADQDRLIDCTKLALFVSMMRSRPSTKQDEKAERELAARLTSQLVKLANCICVVMNKNKIDKEVMKRVSQVAFDTARGRTLEIVKLLYKSGVKGLDIQSITMKTGMSYEKDRTLLRFLIKIKVIEVFSLVARTGLTRPRWRLTKDMTSIYEDAMYIHY